MTHFATIRAFQTNFFFLFEEINSLTNVSDSQYIIPEVVLIFVVSDGVFDDNDGIFLSHSVTYNQNCILTRTEQIFYKCPLLRI